MLQPNCHAGSEASSYQIAKGLVHATVLIFDMCKIQTGADWCSFTNTFTPIPDAAVEPVIKPDRLPSRSDVSNTFRKRARNRSFSPQMECNSEDFNAGNRWT